MYLIRVSQTFPPTLLPENWKRRLEIVDYCTTVVDQTFETEKKVYENQRETQTDPTWHRRAQATLFESEVKVYPLLLFLPECITYWACFQRNHMHNERTVERIVQQKSLDGTSVSSIHTTLHRTVSAPAFRSRCKYFTPPLSDAEGRKLWELALSRS
jgi:hypothetical protein